MAPPSDVVTPIGGDTWLFDADRPSTASLQPGVGHRVHAVARLIRRRFERSVRQAGLPITHTSPYRFTVPSAEQIGRVMEIGERYGHDYSSQRPGNCTSAPGGRTLARLLTHPELPSFNRAYLF